MSGPKYYNFPFGSAQEAANIFAQLSRFQLGVKIRVEDNQIKFTVSNNAWSQGVNHSFIQEEINKAKERHRANEEIKRILNENKKKEKLKIDAKVKNIEKEYELQKEKLYRELSHCGKLIRENVLSRTTPFGTYDLSSELDKVREAEKTIKAELASLDNCKNQCVNECRNAKSSIDKCTSMTELASLQRNVSSIGLPSSNTADSIDAMEASLKDKVTRLENFTSFLNKLFEVMKDKDMMGYFERIKKEVESIDIFDVGAQGKIEKALKSIEDEIALLREREKSNADAREIRERVSAQLKSLGDLSGLLKPVFKSIVVENETNADYTQRSSKIIKESDEIIARINQLEFVNTKNRASIDKLINGLNPLRSSVMSEATIGKLQSIITQLHTLEADCISGNEIYLQFKEEHLRYEDLYIKLQGFISVDEDERDSENKVDEEGEQDFCSPLELALAYENPKKQIEELKKKNDNLTKLLNRCVQEGTFGAIATAVEDKKLGKTFKKEKYKDNSLHLAYVREESKGAIFDVDCGADGRVGIYPRGVVLCNGKTTITPEELQKLHASCNWADEIHSAFESFGMSNCGSYEEMPKEVLQSLYNIKNYYYISSYEESRRYLELSGYTEEEIKEMLGETDIVIDPRKREDVVENKREIKK
ncbi:MAG: hypothetical protein IJ400_04840 [Clostridia bacterium]|nr:hypothetical protein [Clostridia bacterium]